MKRLLFFAVILTAIGCAQKAPVQAVPPVVQSTPTPPPVAPAPVAPLVSASFVAGYNDGYYGTWLSPVRWALGDDYRNGWSAGKWDRCHNLPNRHPR